MNITSFRAKFVLHAYYLKWKWHVGTISTDSRAKHTEAYNNISHPTE